MLLAGALSAPAPAGSQGRVPIEDQLDVVQVDRRLLAVRGGTGQVLEIELELGERVIHRESQGAIALAATSARLLGATSRSAGWKELRLRVEERRALPDRFDVGDRLALVPLGNRIAALAEEGSGWAELQLGPGESLRDLRTSERVGLVLTPRRAIGFPSESRGFAEINLPPQETIERVSLAPNSVTLTTDRRVLLFRTGARFWSELRRQKR